MKNIILSIVVFLSTIQIHANVNGKVTDKRGEPIPGVNIYWLNTTIGTVSDTNGSFAIQNNDSSKLLVFSNVAFQNDTVLINGGANVKVVLNEVIQLSDFDVVSRAPGTVKPRTAVFQTEKITAEELCKAACCNLSESFETNPSVDVAYSDAATGAKQIKLLGLSGTYVQMLTENIPNLRGLSSAFGLGFIPGPWMESIQVSKGTGSVINGYEAITGQINVEYKKPQTSEIVAANMFLSDAGRIELNANASALLSEHLSTGVMLHASDELMSIDENGDNYMDMPMVRQLNFINRWYYKKGGYVSQAFIRALSENRMGGQVSGDYHIDIETKRYELFLKNGYVFNPQKETSVGFIVSGSMHNQMAHYGHKTYDGSQGNLYANLIFQTNFDEHQKISAGTSLNFDNFNEALYVHHTDSFNRKEFVPGIFGEYTLNLDHKFVLLAGLRVDYNSLYGAFVTPRLHMKYVLSDYLHLRTTLGKGYRTPNIMAENNYLLASNRKLVISDDLKMENAWNYGLSTHSYVPFFGRELSLSAEWYHTRFLNQVVVDMDSNPNEVTFSNLNGKSYSNSIQFEANIEVVKGLTLTAAHRINDVKTTIGGELREKPLISRTRSLITTSYQTPMKKWQYDFTAQFNGSGRLPDASGAAMPWAEEFNPYTILNAQVTRYFRKGSVYLGSENLTDFVQKNPIVDVQNPFGDNFDATMVWGPMHGRKFYVGVRWSLERN